MLRIAKVMLPTTLLLALCACTEPVVKAQPMDTWPKPVTSSTLPEDGRMNDRLTAIAAIHCGESKRENPRSTPKPEVQISLIEATNHEAADKKTSPSTRVFKAVVSDRVLDESYHNEYHAKCGFPWNGDAARQLFNDDITKMAASKDDSQGNAHVGYVDSKGKFHDLSGFKEGSYGYADHQINPVFIPGTDRIAYRVGDTWRSVKVDGTDDRHEGALTFDGPFYFNGLNDKPAEASTQNTAFTPDGSTVMDIRAPGNRVPSDDSTCEEPVGITGMKEFENTYVCVSADRKQLNRITTGNKPKVMPLLPQNHHKVASAALTLDGKRVIFVAQMSEYKYSLYSVPVSNTKNEPRLIQDGLDNDTVLVALRQQR
jgi:hypothetical protein